MSKNTMQAEYKINIVMSIIGHDHLEAEVSKFISDWLTDELADVLKLIQVETIKVVPTSVPEETKEEEQP